MGKDKKTFKEKKLRIYGHFREKYDRTFVSRTFGDATFVPMSRSSKSDKWGEYYWRRYKKINRYVGKFIRSSVGRDTGKVYSDFCKFGLEETDMRERIWRDHVIDTQDRNLEWKTRYGDYFYVGDDGTLCYEPRKLNWSKQRRDKRITMPVSELVHNENQTIPDYGAVRDTNGYNHRRGMQPLGEFYVPYKGDTVLCMVYYLPSVKTLSSWLQEKDPAYCKSVEAFKKNFTEIVLYGRKGRLTATHSHYVAEKRKVFEETIAGSVDTGNREYEVFDRGYGELDNLYVITAQADKALEKKKAAKE